MTHACLKPSKTQVDVANQRQERLSCGDGSDGKQQQQQQHNGMGLGLPVNTVGGLWDAVLAPAWLLAAPRRRN